MWEHLKLTTYTIANLSYQTCKQSNLISLTITLLLLLPITTQISANFKHGLRGNESDHEALKAIKSEISSDPPSVLSSWNDSLHFCEWKGVICGHRHQRVVSLALESYNLGGTLSPFIGNLSFLRGLYLDDNLFHGNIPYQISFLPRLQILSVSKNNFEGEIPANLSRCSHLKELDLGYNNLTGKIPKPFATLPKLEIFTVMQNTLSGDLRDIGIGNMSTSMVILSLSLNQLEGSIPDDIGRLKSLYMLGLSTNILSGKIPTSLYNLSSLNIIDLGTNNFHGQLPQDLGLHLPHLVGFLIPDCSLSGQLPISISNLSKIEWLEISRNSFSGKFSINGNNLPHLARLRAHDAFSLGGETRDLHFFDTLTNCSNLTDLSFGGNSFIGNLPPSILNFSTSLEYLDLQNNQITGKIPLGLGKFDNLLRLWMDHNNITGPIPLDLGELRNIQGLYLSNNNFIGEISSSIRNLTRLTNLDISYNYLQGSLPESLGNCTSLQKILATSNSFSGSFPSALFHASGLFTLAVGQNNFEGLFPVEISSLVNLNLLDISQNRFSGEIPSLLGECTSLTFLDMSQNSFIGSIPLSFSSLRSVRYLNLSSNKISGQILKYFSTWPDLLNLNLSFNNLNGEVPTNGIFSNTSFVSLVGNDKLCGGVPTLHLPRCPEVPKPKRRSLSSSALILIISISCAVIVTLSVTLICCYFLYMSRRRKDLPSDPHNIKPFLEVSYQKLHEATEGFSMSNMLGSGGFGTVYKGILHQDDDDTDLVVAVKVMNLQNDGSGKSFLAECKALRNIRHRNLVKIITACSSIDAQRRDFKALVYEFIPRGSLEHWLHSPNHVPITSIENGSCILSLFQRLSITIDIASALEYLHIGCSTPIIHCDLKPSNILLDDEMTARVADFGLAKFVLGSSSTGNDSSSTQVRGTVGYVAPEYGTGRKVSPEGDIYSLGIIILELMTSKKPTDTMFNNGLNLHEFAKSTLPNQVMQIIDHGMLGDDEMLRSRNAINAKKRECIKSIIAIGVQCSMELPQERMKIKDVVICVHRQSTCRHSHQAFIIQLS